MYKWAITLADTANDTHEIRMILATDIKAAAEEGYDIGVNEMKVAIQVQLISWEG